jgi:abortive infection bacteriophage resistance protein
MTPFDNHTDRYIARLVELGFYISDSDSGEDSLQKVRHYIPMIGVARFDEYAYPFKKEMARQRTRVGVSNVLRLYKFDRKLRLLSLDAIERIEIAVKSAVQSELVDIRGPEWFRNSQFVDSLGSGLYRELEHDVFQLPLMTDERGRRKALSEFPSERIMDVLSYKRIERLLTGLRRQHRKNVASRFNDVSAELLVSWFSSFRFVRNTAAHHTRLWNMWFRVAPTIHSGWYGTFGGALPKGYEKRYYAQALAMYYLLKRIARNTRWHYRLHELMSAEGPDLLDIPYIMGFPPDWDKSSFWSIETRTGR